MKYKYAIISILFILVAVHFLLSCSQTSRVKNTQQEIEDFYDKVENINHFCLEIDRLEKKYTGITKDAKLNFGKAEFHRQQVPFAAILRDSYGLWYSELLQLRVCPCMKDAYSHYISCIHFKETAMCCHLEKDQWGFDIANLKDSIEYNKTKKAVLKIMKELNSKAEKLDLPLPFPKYTIDSFQIIRSGG